MTDKELFKLALDALEANYLLVNGTETHGGLEQCLDGYYSSCFDTDPINKQTEESITALKERLAQPEQEPVAWEWRYDSCGHAVVNRFAVTETPEPTLFLKNVFARGPFPLYKHPPQRTWVGLTLERKMDMAESYFSDEWAINRAVQLLNGCENALKKENT